MVVKQKKCHGDLMARIDPKFMLRLPPDLKDRVQEAAEDGHQSMNALIVSILESRFPDKTIDHQQMAEALGSLYRDAVKEGGGRVIETLNDRFAEALGAWKVSYENGNLVFTPQLKREVTGDDA